jgi:hypothetical protein
MSDPVTNAEVEDVLSSIRRLVSEDKRPLKPGNVAVANDRLVLTPSLRVQDPVEGDSQFEGGSIHPQEQSQEQAQEPQPARGNLDSNDEAPFDFDRGSEGQKSEAPQNSENAQSLEPLVLTQEAESPEPVPEEWITEEVDAPSATEEVQQPPEPVETYAEQDEEPQENAEGHDWEEDVWDAEEPQDHQEQSADLTQPQQDDASTDVAAFFDSSEQSDNSDMAETPEPSEDNENEKSDNVLSMSAASAALGASTGLSAKIAALETAIGGISDNFEPETAGQDIYAATKPDAMAWEDVKEKAAAEETPSDFAHDNQSAGQAFDAATGFDAGEQIAETIGEGVEETVLEAAAAGVTASALASAPPTLDEAALRDLVGEIVRAELQGALGERITRNVRKLVRREIHRALTAQELE